MDTGAKPARRCQKRSCGTRQAAVFERSVPRTALGCVISTLPTLQTRKGGTEGLNNLLQVTYPAVMARGLNPGGPAPEATLLTPTHPCLFPALPASFQACQSPSPDTCRLQAAGAVRSRPSSHFVLTSTPGGGAAPITLQVRSGCTGGLTVHPTSHSPAGQSQGGSQVCQTPDAVIFPETAGDSPGQRARSPSRFAPHLTRGKRSSRELHKGLR